MSSLPVIERAADATRKRATRLGFWTSILLAVLAVAAFALGITTPPRSGPYCPANCITYPYTDAAQFVPRDYLWVVPSVFLLPVFVVLAGCIHSRVPSAKNHLSVIGLCFASIATSLIALDYFVQLQVLEPSLLKGETVGLSPFTQYNPHGFFIALEDLGYLALSAAFIFIGAAFIQGGRLVRSIGWTFIVSALLDFVTFLAMTWHFGLSIDYRFEVVTITIHWTALLVLGILLAVYFRPGNRNATN